MLWLSNTVGFWNFRPIPSSAILVSSSRVRSVTPSNSTSPSSGLVLPVMMSIMVVLPAPFGPMMASSWPGAMGSERKIQVVDGVKAVKRDMHAIEIEQCGSGTGVHDVHRSLRHIGFADAVFARRAGGVRLVREAPRVPWPPPGVESAHDPLGQ